MGKISISIVASISLIALIISLTPIVEQVFAQTETIPPWIKKTAEFWANNEITDQEFVAAMEFLIERGIIDVTGHALESIIVLVSSEIENIETIEIPVTEESKDDVVDSNLHLLQFKIIQMQEFASHPDIIQALIDSNAKFAEMKDPDAYIDEKDEAWIKQDKYQNSPFMSSIIENKVADLLKTKTVIESEKYGEVLFPEIILANALGANVASTIRTEDYKQSDEGWFIKVKDEYFLVRNVMWDESAKIYSADLVFKIVDDDGKFIGVLKVATPIR